MDTRRLLEILSVAERLKDTTRHCCTSQGRRESVAEHSWRAALMAYFLRDEFPEADMDRVIRMCLLHDMGEAFTGDVPTFEKSAADEQREAQLLDQWVGSLPEEYAGELREMYAEMAALTTPEARIYKAIDSLEALIQHNESPLESWLPLEYDLQMTYADARMEFSPYMKALRQTVREDSIQKIENGKAE